MSESDPRDWQLDNDGKTSRTFVAPGAIDGYRITCDPKSEFGVVVYRETPEGERFFEGHAGPGGELARTRAREQHRITISTDKNAGRFAYGTIVFTHQ